MRLQETRIGNRNYIIALVTLKPNAFRVIFSFQKNPTGQSHRAYDQVRPTFDRKMLESLANRRKDVRLVAEVVGDRQGKISRIKVDGHVQNL